MAIGLHKWIALGLAGLGLWCLWVSPWSNPARLEIVRLSGYSGCMCRDCQERLLPVTMVRRFYGCAPSNPPYVEHFGVMLECAAGFAAVGPWVLRRVRPRADPMACRACGYSQEGLTSSVCPECGAGRESA